MNDDQYLWNGTGPPDPNIQKLEKKLASLRYQPTARQERAPAPRRTFVLWRFAAVAAVLVLGVALWLARSAPEPVALPGVQVTALAGAPSVDDKSFQTGTLSKGQWLETNDASQAKLTLPEIGQIVVKPNSRLQLVNLADNQQRLSLERGSIEASVVAPPRLFIVDTPSAQAVDLGCAYTLDVDEEGNSVLHVTSGYVAFEKGELVSIVPAGARCHTWIKHGPGTPFYEDASAEVQAAIKRIDFKEASKQDLQLIVSQAQPKDSLTLWHLLPRVEESWRPMIIAALQQIEVLPPGVSVDDIIRLDSTALHAWRRKLSQYW
jgi:ferric-dicitrate binding protein FerR (iron transport regulator)